MVLLKSMKIMKAMILRDTWYDFLFLFSTLKIHSILYSTQKLEFFGRSNYPFLTPFSEKKNLGTQTFDISSYQVRVIGFELSGLSYQVNIAIRFTLLPLIAVTSHIIAYFYQQLF